MPSEKKSPSILVGCSGFAYLHWRGHFYPVSATYSEMLPVYARQFDTLEINGTFYGYLRPGSIARWVDQVPEGFLFSVKAPGQVVLAKPGEEMALAFEHLMRLIAPLEQRNAFGALLLQIPAAVERDLDRLKALLDLPMERRLDLAFDFRHPSWYEGKVFDLLADRGADAAAVSRPGGPPFLTVLGTHKYFRFNGLKREGTYDYPYKELEEIGARLKSAGERADRVYAYFNNPGKGCAPVNARTLLRKILTPPEDG